MRALVVSVFLLAAPALLKPLEAVNACLKEISIIPKYLIYDQDMRVPYLSPDQQEPIRIKLQNGIFTSSDGTPTDFKGDKMFVVDLEGKLVADYAGRRPRFHHSSLSAGQDVALAGWIRIEKGQIRRISNLSGHYQPSLQSLREVILFWQSQSADISELQVGFRVAITSSVASSFFYNLPIEDFLRLMEMEPQSAEELLKIILHSDLDRTKKAIAAAHLLMTGAWVESEHLELLLSEVIAGNRSLLLEFFDLIPSDHFPLLLELTKDIEHPELRRLHQRYIEFLAEQ